MGVLFSILLCSYHSVLISNVLHNKTSCFTNIYWKFEDSFPSSLESIKVLHNSNRSEDGVWMYVCNFVYRFLFSCIILSCVSNLFMVNILVLSANFSLPFGQRPRRGRWPMLSHIGEISPSSPSTPFEAHILASRLKSQPWGPNLSLEAQILARMPKFWPGGPNLIFEVQIPALRPKS